MAIVTVPTSRDIYIEINGQKLAVAQSYKARTTRESRYVEAFGSEEPVGTIGGRTRHVVELSRVVISEGAVSDGVDFYALSGFNLVIVKPDRKLIYSGCEWSEISENANLNDTVIEWISLVAQKRMEVR